MFWAHLLGASLLASSNYPLDTGSATQTVNLATLNGRQICNQLVGMNMTEVEQILGLPSRASLLFTINGGNTPDAFWLWHDGAIAICKDGSGMVDMAWFVPYRSKSRPPVQTR